MEFNVSFFLTLERCPKVTFFEREATTQTQRKKTNMHRHRIDISVILNHPRGSKETMDDFTRKTATKRSFATDGGSRTDTKRSKTDMDIPERNPPVTNEGIFLRDDVSEDELYNAGGRWMDVNEVGEGIATSFEVLEWDKQEQSAELAFVCANSPPLNLNGVAFGSFLNETDSSSRDQESSNLAGSSKEEAGIIEEDGQYPGVGSRSPDHFDGESNSSSNEEFETNEEMDDGSEESEEESVLMKHMTFRTFLMESTPTWILRRARLFLLSPKQ